MRGKISLQPPDWQDHKDHFEWFRDTFDAVYVFSAGTGGYAPSGGMPFGFALDPVSGLRLILFQEEMIQGSPVRFWRHQSIADTRGLPSRLELWNLQRSFFARRAGIAENDLRQLATLVAILNPDRPSMDSPPP